LPHDQAAHHGDHAHEPGILRHRPSARKRKDSFDPTRAFLGKRLDTFFLISAAPQPIGHVPSARSATIAIAFLDLFRLLRERDRMPSAKQAKGQRIKEKRE